MQIRVIIINAIPSPARENALLLTFYRPSRQSSMQQSQTLTVLLAIGILRHKARDTMHVWDRIVHIFEGERRTAAHLRVLGKKIDVNASGQIVRERDVGGKVGRGVQCAGALAAVKSLVKGMLVDPVGARERAGKTGGDAVAGGFDAVAEEEVDFGDDAGHVDALVVADAAGFVVRDQEVGEGGGVDFIFADGA